MFNPNPILSKDFYKVGHPFQYPEKTQGVYSNFTARSGKHFSLKIDGVVFWKLQSFLLELNEFFKTGFFDKSKEDVIKEFKRRTDISLGLNSVDTKHIEELHDLGYLPLEFKALPEGTVVPFGVPMFTVENTHSNFAWLTNSIETVMSAELWKAITVATIAREYRKLLSNYAVKTGSPLEFVDWQGHDFSMRGLSGLGDSANAAGHLLSFTGTDTIPAIEYLEHYYGGLNSFVGGSVPATEHSVMCAGGKETEEETIRRIITQVYPSGVVSVVSDTWDFWKTITIHAANLKQEILDRKPNSIGLAKVVFRPDSGNPVDIICGSIKVKSVENEEEALNWFTNNINEAIEETVFDYNNRVVHDYFKFNDENLIRKITIGYSIDYYEHFDYNHKIISNEIVELIPEQKGALECLWDIFGGTYTSTGHKVLNERVGLIYGDSITLELAKEILERMEAKGFASCNIVFGIGSYTYQYITRDTFGMAMKSTWALVDDEERMLFKDPVTDSGAKKSARGRLFVNSDEEGKLYLIDGLTKEEYTNIESIDYMKPVWRDGKLLVFQTLEEIRERLRV